MQCIICFCFLIAHTTATQDLKKRSLKSLRGYIFTEIVVYLFFRFAKTFWVHFLVNGTRYDSVNTLHTRGKTAAILDLDMN